MKIQLISDDELPPNNTTEIPSMIIVLELFFHENNVCMEHKNGK